LDSLASRVGEKIKKNNRDEAPAKVLVFDFTWMSPGISSRFGTILADHFSEMLKAHSNGVEVLDRKLLDEYLKNTLTRIEDLKSNSACLQIGEDLGATEIIRANLVEEGTQELSVLVQAVGSEPPFSDQIRFAITKQMEDMLSEPVPSYSQVPDPIPPEPGVLVMGSGSIDGVSSPSCITCPDPNYTEVARSERLNGTVVLSAVITIAGDVTAIHVVKPLPLGLTQRAIETARKWKLKPATKDGNPLPVRVDITFTFKVL